MRYGDRGQDVVEVQRALMARGYALPKYGADGVLGSETWDALQKYARDATLVWNPEVPPVVLEDLVVPSSLVVKVALRRAISEPKPRRIEGAGGASVAKGDHDATRAQVALDGGLGIGPRQKRHGQQGGDTSPTIELWDCRPDTFPSASRIAESAADTTRHGHTCIGLHRGTPPRLTTRRKMRA